MFSLLKSLAHIFDFSAYPAQDRDDRYLADAADIHDLERRMRQLDSGRANAYSIGTTGVFTR